MNDVGKGAKKSEAQSYPETLFVYMQQVYGVKVTRLTCSMFLLEQAMSRGIAND